MPPFHSIHMAAPAHVREIRGGAELLGALPSQKSDLKTGQVLENHRIALAPGTRVLLEVEGGEQLPLEAPAGEPRTYFLHVIDPERIRQAVAMK